MGAALIVSAFVLVYVVTVAGWFRYGRSYRDRMAILLSNIFLMVFYLACFAIDGDSPPGDLSTGSKWYEGFVLAFMIHLVLFWLFMLLQLLIELLTSTSKPRSK